MNWIESGGVHDTNFLCTAGVRQWLPWLTSLTDPGWPWVTCELFWTDPHYSLICGHLEASPLKGVLSKLVLNQAMVWLLQIRALVFYGHTPIKESRGRHFQTHCLLLQVLQKKNWEAIHPSSTTHNKKGIPSFFTFSNKKDQKDMKKGTLRNV
jgi:hypothetical protein